jgi:hypothetical protein
MAEKIKDVPIKARVIVEIVGKPKEHVEKAMNEYVGKIKKDPRMKILEEDIAPVKEEGEYFGTFAEIVMDFKDMFILGNFCFDYMPSSIEVIEPEEIKLTNRDIAAVFNDLQGKLHRVDMVAKQANMQNRNLKTNMHGLLKNFLGVLLKIKPMNCEKLCIFVGTDEKTLKPLLEGMVRDNFLKKEGEEYSLK